jgi:hypothetical protein
MVVRTGSNDFMKQFIMPSRGAGAALRYLFSPAADFARNQNQPRVVREVVMDSTRILISEQATLSGRSVLSQELTVLKIVIDQAIHSLNTEVAKQKEKAELKNALSSIVKNIDGWYAYTKKKLEIEKKLDENVLAILDKAADLYQLMPHMQDRAILANAEVNNALQSIRSCLQDLRDKLQAFYSDKYWELTSEKEHEIIVIQLVKDEIYRTFQFFKAAARVHATGIYERKKLTTGENAFKAAKETAGALLSLVSGLGEGFKFLGGLAGMSFETQAWAGSEVLNKGEEIIAAGIQFSMGMSEILSDPLDAINGSYSRIRRLINDFLGTTEINNRIKAIADNFSATGGQSKPERLAEEFVHYYREQILLLTKHDAKVFANLLGIHIRQFLMLKDPKYHTSQDMINWLMHESFYRSKNLKLRSPMSLVPASALVQCAGLKCLDANGAEVAFNLMVWVDGTRGDKYARWVQTDSYTYGYRIAEKDAVDALTLAIYAYREGEIPADEEELIQFKISHDELSRLKTVALPLSVISSPFQSVRDRVSTLEGKIQEMEASLAVSDKESSQLKKTVDQLSEAIGDQKEVIDTLTTNLRVLTSIVEEQKKTINDQNNRLAHLEARQVVRNPLRALPAPAQQPVLPRQQDAQVPPVERNREDVAQTGAIPPAAQVIEQPENVQNQLRIDPETVLLAINRNGIFAPVRAQPSMDELSKIEGIGKTNDS